MEASGAIRGEEGKKESERNGPWISARNYK